MNQEISSKAVSYPPSKTAPWAHQQKAWEMGQKYDGFYLALDMGCCSGDAIVAIRRANVTRRITIREAYGWFHSINRTKRWNPTLPMFTKSLFPDGILRSNQIMNILYKGVKDVVKLTLESGKELVLTPDHEILTGNHEMVAVEKLSPGDKAFTNGVPAYDRSGQRNSNYKTGKIIDKDGYVRLSSMWDHPRANPAGQVYEHIVVMEKVLGRPIPVGEEIHHKDKNRQNNDPSNLYVTKSKSEHNRLDGLYKNMDGGTTGTGGTIYFTPREDRIKSIEPCGQTEVYDLVMADPARNFVANKIIVHNCGKTKTAIDYANGFDANTILIICPKAVIPTWPREFGIHSHAHYQVIGADFKKSWSAQKKALEISTTLQRNIRAGVKTIVVLNYDVIYRPPIGPTRNKKNRIIDVGVLLKYNWDLLIVDEAHKIKSASGKASWMCKSLGKRSKRRLLLSGTPMPHSPVDIYAQFRCLDDRIYGTSHARFKDRYCILGGFDGKQIVAYKNERDLHNRFHSRAIIVNKRDVLDLPKTTHIRRNVDLPPKLMKLYNELAEDFVVGLENGEITTENALTKLLRLAQLTSGFAQYDNGSNEIVDDTKIKELEDIVDGLKTDEPLVIFCRFTQEIERVKKLMIDMGRSVGELSGKQNNLAEFRDGRTDTLVVQVQAGSAGIDLTRAAYCVYFSKGFSLGDYEQSLARIDRPGQTRPVTYYHINANATVDIQIDRALEKRKVVVNCILNNVDALIAAKTFIRKTRAA